MNGFLVSSYFVSKRLTAIIVSRPAKQWLNLAWSLIRRWRATFSRLPAGGGGVLPP
jgi:hypothetical protein